MMPSRAGSTRAAALVVAILLASVSTARGDDRPCLPPPPPGTPPEAIHCAPCVRERPPFRYDTSSIFPLTRGLTNRCWHPALTAPLAPLTLAVDLVGLPFGLVLGFF